MSPSGLGDSSGGLGPGSLPPRVPGAEQDFADGDAHVLKRTRFNELLRQKGP